MVVDFNLNPPPGKKGKKWYKQRRKKGSNRPEVGEVNITGQAFRCMPSDAAVTHTFGPGPAVSCGKKGGPPFWPQAPDPTVWISKGKPPLKQRNNTAPLCAKTTSDHETLRPVWCGFLPQGRSLTSNSLVRKDNDRKSSELNGPTKETPVWF